MGGRKRRGREVVVEEVFLLFLWWVLRRNRSEQPCSIVPCCLPRWEIQLAVLKRWRSFVLHCLYHTMEIIALPIRIFSGRRGKERRRLLLLQKMRSQRHDLVLMPKLPHGRLKLIGWRVNWSGFPSQKIKIQSILLILLLQILTR